MELLELATRVEALTGPDRDVDVLIGLTGRFYVAEPRCPGAEPMIGYVDDDGSRVEPGNGAQDSLVPRYTASLDAAMSLLPSDWYRVEQQQTNDGAWARVTRLVVGFTPDAEAHAPTPALALVAAALRARGTQQ
jgi:hypothetical protein